MSTLKTTNLQHASAASPAIVLASSGSATAQLSSINDGPIAGARNRIINGGFDIWQRGTSQTAAGYGSADRWYLSVAGTCTHSQETSVIPTGAQYALKWTTGASSSYGQVRQFIERLNVIPLRGQVFTASAYVRSGGTFSGDLVFEIAYNTSSDAVAAGGWTVISTTTSGTVSSSAYTQIKTTFTVPSNAVGLYVGIVPDVVQASGAIAYHSLVQLEPGSVATPFERRSYGQELALCQRYYYKHAEGVSRIVGYGTYWTAAQFEAGVFFPVTMRTTPTLVQTTGTNYYNIATNSTYDYLDSLSTANGNANGLILFNNSQSAGTAGHGGRLETNNAAAHISFSAEL